MSRLAVALGAAWALGCSADSEATDHGLPEPYIPPYTDVEPSSPQGIPDSGSLDVSDDVVTDAVDASEVNDLGIFEEDTCITTGLDVVTCF